MKYSLPSDGVHNPLIFRFCKAGAVQNDLASSRDASDDSVLSDKSSRVRVCEDPIAEASSEADDPFDLRVFVFAGLGNSHFISFIVSRESLKRIKVAMAGISSGEARRFDFMTSTVFRVSHFGAATDKI
tara:strand:- start:22 stop:408 length:387 start_codon:yes stop_codon:yes gene_type:complete